MPLGAPVDPNALVGGSGSLNPLAAALMQGAMPGQTGAPATTAAGSLLQTGGAVPGAVPLGAPTNQYGAPTLAPPEGPQFKPIPNVVPGVGGPGAPLPTGPQLNVPRPSVATVPPPPVPTGPQTNFAVPRPGLGNIGGAVPRPFGFGGIPGYRGLY